MTSALPTVERKYMTQSKRPGTEYHVIHGRYPGPVVMITGGIHGTEIAGVEAASRCSNIQIRNGTLIIVPLVNPFAYRKRIRGKPDINRTFPKSSKGKARHIISRRVFQLAKKYNPSWCIDLHEANGFYRINRKRWGQTLIVYPNSDTKRISTKVVEEINQKISRHTRKFSVRTSVLPGSFRTAAGRVLGCHAVTIETSMQQPKRSRVQYQAQIVQLLLKHIGMI